MTDTESNAPQTPEVERPPLAKIAGVRYLGNATERSISAADLAAVGVQSKHDLTWNGYGDIVPTSFLNAAVADFLASDPAEFELVPTEGA